MKLAAHLMNGIDLIINGLDGQWIWKLVVKNATGLESLEQVALRVEGAQQVEFDGPGKSALHVQTTVGDFALIGG